MKFDYLTTLYFCITCIYKIKITQGLIVKELGFHEEWETKINHVRLHLSCNINKVIAQ